MILRIRLDRGRPIQRKLRKNRHVALALSALLTPLALMAYVLGLWRLASDMGFTGELGFTGFFSHWQIWIPTGALLQATGASLSRYGRGEDVTIPRVLHILPARPEKKFPDRKVSSR